ncbi:MAG TPA: tripartite tricarboxylate transporter TctB family protein [Longimicrobiales bacterium]|nr:tripartite tricarboxylate transporter TctB family protein [Longimicrobiales bacterium]
MSDGSTRTDRVAGLVVAALGLAVGAEATTFDVLFRADPVGPKALPFLAAVVFVGSGAYLTARPGRGGVWPPRVILARMAGAVAAFGAYAALLAPLGFVVATTTTVSALSILFGGPWRKAVGAAVTLSVVLWYLFVWVLGLQLPLGWVWGSIWMR